MTSRLPAAGQAGGPGAARGAGADRAPSRLFRCVSRHSGLEFFSPFPPGSHGCAGSCQALRETRLLGGGAGEQLLGAAWPPGPSEGWLGGAGGAGRAGPGRSGLGCVARRSVSEAGPAPACVAGPVGSGLRAAIPLWSLLSLFLSPLPPLSLLLCIRQRTRTRDRSWLSKR